MSHNLLSITTVGFHRRKAVAAESDFWPATESPVSTFDVCPYFYKFPDTRGHVWEEEQQCWPCVHRVNPPVLHLAASVDAAAQGKPPVHMLSHAPQTMLAALVKKHKVGRTAS